MREHRGGLILGLGITSLVLGLLCTGAICLPLPLPLGIAGWVMGRSDLYLIDKGEMNPAGRGNTHAGMICSIISVAIMGIALLMVAGSIILMMAMGPEIPNQ